MIAFLSVLTVIVGILFVIVEITASIGTPMFLIFLTLKLCKVITWSWWAVCSPIMAIGGLFLLWFIFYFVYHLIATKI